MELNERCPIFLVWSYEISKAFLVSTRKDDHCSSVRMSLKLLSSEHLLKGNKQKAKKNYQKTKKPFKVEYYKNINKWFKIFSRFPST